MTDYSVRIKGYTEKPEALNAISVIELNFGIVIHGCEDAFDASKVAINKLCVHVNIELEAFHVTHIDTVPVDER